jgi:hypothetical protein
MLPVNDAAFGRHRESGVATSLTATVAETKQGLSDCSGTTALEIFHEHISPDGFCSCILFPPTNICFESLRKISPRF